MEYKYSIKADFVLLNKRVITIEFQYISKIETLSDDGLKEIAKLNLKDNLIYDSINIVYCKKIK